MVFDSTTVKNTPEAGVVAQLAQQAVAPQFLVPRSIYAVADRDGSIKVIDTLAYAGLDGGRPQRKTGTTEVHDADAFSWLVAKHGLDETEIFSDVRAQSLTAVLNAHGGPPPTRQEDGTYARTEATAYSTQLVRHETQEPTEFEDGDDTAAGWGDHRIVLKLHKTTAWLAWERLDRKLLPQADFAEHVEERLVDFRSPAGGDMLELAQTFQGARAATFESSERLSDGQVQLSYREETKATAGKAGRLTIPETFELALVPFEGGKAYKVEARLRYRLDGGHLRLGYLLTRPEDILRAAFLDEVEAVAVATGRTVLNGVAPHARTGHEV